MTKEEALNDIIENGINLGAGDFIDTEALKIAAEVLKKHIIPMKVNVKLSEAHLKYGYDIKNRDVYTCSSCNRRLRNKQKDLYCSNCAQALDWDINI